MEIARRASNWILVAALLIVLDGCGADRVSQEGIGIPRGDMTLYNTPTPDFAVATEDAGAAGAVKAAVRLLRPTASSRLLAVSLESFEDVMCGRGGTVYGPISVWVVVFEGVFGGGLGAARRSDGSIVPTTRAVIVDSSFTSLQILGPWPVPRDPKAICPSSAP